MSAFSIDGRRFRWLRDDPAGLRLTVVCVETDRSVARACSPDAVVDEEQARELVRAAWSELTGEGALLESPADFDRQYLATDDPVAQSGYGGTLERWEAARRTIVEAIDRPGTFLDIGCANGLLMESIAKWSKHAIEPHGVDFAPALVECARTRLPQWADRIHQADANTWNVAAPFDFVHARLDFGDVASLLRLGKRLIVSSDGSFRRALSARAQAVGDRLRALGLQVAGERYHRDDEHQCEIAVAWVDSRRTGARSADQRHT